MTFFPDHLPCPDIQGPMKMDDQDETEFFLFTWPKMEKIDLIALSYFLQGRQGVPLKDWTNPGDNRTWTVSLSDERTPEVHDATAVNPSFTVELVAFILGASKEATLC